MNLLKICDQTGHKSLQMLRVYCRDAELFVGNAALSGMIPLSARSLGVVLMASATAIGPLAQGIARVAKR